MPQGAFASRVLLFPVLLGLFLLLGAGAAARSDPTDQAEAQGLVLARPPAGRIYHAAYPGFGNAEEKVTRRSIRHFEALAGRRIAWVYFSNNWWRGRIRFPGRAVRTITGMGRTPFIRLMARSSWATGADPNFSMQSFIEGRWDPELRRWCDQAAALEVPILAEFGTEVNGSWFPWNGKWNGGGRTNGYGDPLLADGPERFRDAYRHLIGICRNRGAVDITWFFHVDVAPDPAAAWNREYLAYYPGDDYIDWIGLSNYGKLDPLYDSPRFQDKLDSHWSSIRRISREKPVAVLEYGRMQSPGDRAKARWIARAIGSVASGRWPRVQGLAYWNERFPAVKRGFVNLRIDSSRRATSAYRRGVSGRQFTGHPIFKRRTKAG